MSPSAQPRLSGPTDQRLPNGLKPPAVPCLFSWKRKAKAVKNSGSDVANPSEKSEEEEEIGNKKGGLKKEETSKAYKVERKGKWSSVDNCCWFIGRICTIWWVLLFLYNAMPASFPQYVTEAIPKLLPDPSSVNMGGNVQMVLPCIQNVHRAPGFLDNNLFQASAPNIATCNKDVPQLGFNHVSDIERWGHHMCRGDHDWSPKEACVPSKKRQRSNDAQLARQKRGSLGSQ